MDFFFISDCTTFLYIFNISFGQQEKLKFHYFFLLLLWLKSNKMHSDDQIGEHLLICIVWLLDQYIRWKRLVGDSG